MPAKNLWTREELILALNLYLKLPFGKLHSRNPDIIHLASIIGRNANAVAMRLNNFASVDPYHQERGIKGLVGGIKQVLPIWDEFINNKEELIFESETILADREAKSLEEKYADVLRNIDHLKGEYKIREVKTRVNQSVFREIVLANYDTKCALTGIDIPELLLASHIVPWSKNEAERLNPENGICLSALYDRAFDKGLIAINARYEVMISPKLQSHETASYYEQHFAPLKGAKLELPRKYLPKKEFLEFHLDSVFKS